MNLKEYIESGILEAYLAGELNEKGMRDVEDMAKKYPEVQQEIDSLREAINVYAASSRKEISDKVLNNTLIEISETEKNRFMSVLNEEPDVQIKRVNVIPFWSIAASILLVISLGFNYFFFQQFKNTREELSKLRGENIQLVEEISNTEESLEYAQLRVAHFLSEDNIHVRMDGLDLSPESYANVFWNKNTNSVFISVDNLPEPPHGHQYQLWAIKEGRAPIDAGIFDHNQLVQELKVIKGNVQAFAVTLEKEGGSPIATVEKTFVKGSIPSI